MTTDPRNVTENLYGPDPISHRLACEIRWLVGCFRARCEAAGGDAPQHCAAMRTELYDILTGRERVFVEQPEAFFTTLLRDHGIEPERKPGWAAEDHAYALELEQHLALCYDIGDIPEDAWEERKQHRAEMIALVGQRKR